MNKPIVSVIIPVYNVEQYLKQCLDSVINQTYKNLEIILVDDGSTDNSGKICDEYALKDTRIKVIHKDNGGLSDARNTGLKIATGEYITFIDSDDDIELDMVEYLYSVLIKFNCKMSVCTHNVIKNNRTKKSFNLKEDFKLSSFDCIKKMLYHDGTDTSAWAKLYKKDLFENIMYPKGKLFEDIATTYKLFIKSDEIASGHLAKYNYKIRSNSIVRKSFTKAKLDLIENTDNMAKDVLAIFPDLEKALLRRRVYARFSTLNQVLSFDKENKHVVKEIISFIKKYTWNILTDTNVQLRDKVAIILLNISYNLYKFIWQKSNSIRW